MNNIGNAKKAFHPIGVAVETTLPVGSGSWPTDILNKSLRLGRPGKVRQYPEVGQGKRKSLYR